MMTFSEAKVFAANLVEEHPEGCSCGSPNCLSRSEPDYDTIEAELIRDQTDWESPAAKEAFCVGSGILCI